MSNGALSTLSVHHIGYIVKDIAKALSVFEGLGYSLDSSNTEAHYDEFRDIDILFIEKDGYRIELIAPSSRESSFYPLLKKYKNCSYHVCYRSENVESDTEQLLESGWRQVTPFDPASALGGRKVGFFLHPHIGMIELIDEQSG